MAKVVSEVVTIRFSRLVKDSAEGTPSIVKDEDLELLQGMVDEIDEADSSRVIELELGEGE